MKGLDRSLFADPKQKDGAQIDLINQCQILVPFGVLDFSDAGSVDLARGPMFQAASDCDRTLARSYRTSMLLFSALKWASW